MDYSYDARDRILLENATAYGWDDNGNLTSKAGEATYTWDFEDRLVRVEAADGTVVEHEYDVDGTRVETVVTPAGAGAPEVTDYLVDTSGTLSQVVAETDDAGVLKAYYVRGDDLLAVIRGADASFYHSDGLGSVRALTDAGGTVTDRYAYSAFGERWMHDGDDVQPYQFTGEPWDLNAGYYYLRDRYYAPGTGRFVSRDRNPGLLFEPETLHKYLYCASNPANLVDHSGQFFSLPGVMVSLTIHEIVVSYYMMQFRMLIHATHIANSMLKPAYLMYNVALACIAQGLDQPFVWDFLAESRQMIAAGYAALAEEMRSTLIGFWANVALPVKLGFEGIEWNLYDLISGLRNGLGPNATASDWADLMPTITALEGLQGIAKAAANFLGVVGQNLNSPAAIRAEELALVDLIEGFVSSLE